ncbi:hypothetical protein RFI_07274 [Reticulomyxa filosa]|uniref:protein-serine/threonine phosphatase n=1 Tax=Reticulomyxa filosa TaxID=46433 RepID=X6NU76_RETFI|nr:hypothetical protein RFI_07274 [Reticulomyxa filosa]|eukprot:ETO29845.1 hypothetical protein RFI_07274 [Reticulomyxa filosa]
MAIFFTAKKIFAKHRIRSIATTHLICGNVSNNFGNNNSSSNNHEVDVDMVDSRLSNMGLHSLASLRTAPMSSSQSSFHWFSEKPYKNGDNGDVFSTITGKERHDDTYPQRPLAQVSPHTKKMDVSYDDPLFPSNWKTMTKADHAKHIEDVLHSHKKLVLFLDVDHTLLHSTREIQAQRYQTHSVFGRDIHPIDFPNPYDATYFIKFRPYFYQFIDVVSEMFFVALYTMGSRPYAEEVARVIDTWAGKTVIGNRIVCREDHDDPTKVHFYKYACICIYGKREKKTLFPNL